MCPFIKSKYKSRSFTAFALRSGMNWSQFLGLGDIAPSAQSRMLPQDENVPWTIELPEVRLNSVEAPMPVRELIQSIESGDEESVIRSLPKLNDQGIYDFFPRIHRRSIAGDDSTVATPKGVEVITPSGSEPSSRA